MAFFVNFSYVWFPRNIFVGSSYEVLYVRPLKSRLNFRACQFVSIITQKLTGFDEISRIFGVAQKGSDYSFGWQSASFRSVDSGTSEIASIRRQHVNWDSVVFVRWQHYRRRFFSAPRMTVFTLLLCLCVYIKSFHIAWSCVSYC